LELGTFETTNMSRLQNFILYSSV